MTEVKLEDLRQGDEVDVVLRGLRFRFVDRDGDPAFRTEAGNSWAVAKEWFTDATITRRDPPIEVGDTVADIKKYHAKVLFIAKDHALLDYGPEEPDLLRHLDALTLISKGPKS